MKIITRNIVWICCLLCMTVSCSNDTDALIADGDEVVVHLSFSPNQSSTRVSLQESAESLDLTTHWENGDEVDLYVMYDGKVEHIGKVPIKGISEDGKDCIISYKKPKVVEDGLTDTPFCKYVLESGLYRQAVDQEVVRSDIFFLNRPKYLAKSKIYECPDLENIMFPVTVDDDTDVSFTKQQMEQVRSSLMIIPH